MCQWKPKSEAVLVEGGRYLVTLKYPNWKVAEVQIAEYHSGAVWLVDKYGWQSEKYIFSVADLPAPAPVPLTARCVFLPPRWPWPYSTKNGG
jgi:hypothetical protein